MIIRADQTNQMYTLTDTFSHPNALKLGQNILKGRKKFSFQRFFDIVIVVLSSAMRKLSSSASQLKTILTYVFYKLPFRLKKSSD